MAVDVNVDPYPQTELFTEQRARFEGREFTRDIQGRWVDEWGNQIQTDKKGDLVLTNGKPTLIKPTEDAWVTHSLARWQGKTAAPQDWFIENWLPIGQTFGLYGRPGSRKSTLLLQWMIAGCLGRKFGNVLEPLAQGPCYGLFCEDGENEIFRRAEAMLTGYRASFADLQHCHAESLVHANLTTFVTFRRSGLMVPTPAWEKFLRDLDNFKPVFVCLDVLANFFGGNEISRNETTAFIRLLDKTADERGFACAYAAHPSLRGLKDGTLTSGSTGWEGGTRALGTLADPSDEDDDELDENTPQPKSKTALFNRSQRRILTLAKTNYAQNGQEMDLTFRNGMFIPTDIDPKTAPLRGFQRELAARAKFKDLLDAITQQGRYVHDTRTSPDRYAPNVFASHPNKGSFKKADFEKAMRTLLDKGEIKPGTHHKARCLVRVHHSGENDP